MRNLFVRASYFSLPHSQMLNRNLTYVWGVEFLSTYSYYFEYF